MWDQRQLVVERCCQRHPARAVQHRSWCASEPCGRNGVQTRSCRQGRTIEPRARNRFYASTLLRRRRPRGLRQITIERRQRHPQPLRQFQIGRIVNGKPVQIPSRTAAPQAFAAVSPSTAMPSSAKSRSTPSRNAFHLSRAIGSPSSAFAPVRMRAAAARAEEQRHSARRRHRVCAG
jgi:hypothetical protein